MWGSCLRLALVALAALSLWGCSRTPEFIAAHEPWREDEERACLASGRVQPGPFVLARAALGGPSVCGALQPFTMAAADNGNVMLEPPALVRCPMVPAIDRWVRETVDPAARGHFGSPVAELRVAASYACRPMNHQSGGRLSEHGHANALDISEFVLRDGRRVAVKSGWAGDARERSFLRAVHAGACAEFTTVLGPDHDRLHRDHFHLDLARHGAGGAGQICR